MPGERIRARENLHRAIELIQVAGSKIQEGEINLRITNTKIGNESLKCYYRSPFVKVLERLFSAIRLKPPFELQRKLQSLNRQRALLPGTIRDGYEQLSFRLEQAQDFAGNTPGNHYFNHLRYDPSSRLFNVVFGVEIAPDDPHLIPASNSFPSLRYQTVRNRGASFHIPEDDDESPILRIPNNSGFGVIASLADTTLQRHLFRPPTSHEPTELDPARFKKARGLVVIVPLR